MVTDSVIPIKAAKRGNVSLVVSNQFSDRPEKGEAKKYDDVTIDFGIAPMGVKPGELTTVHKIEITRDGKSAEVFFRCEPVFKKVPAAMWDKPVFVKGSNDQFLEKPEINPERQLVPGVLGGLEVLPADPPHCGDTLPVDRRELRYDTKLIGDAFQWEEIPAFKAAVFEEGEAEKGKAAKKRLKDTILITADEGDAWKARKDIRDELGLGREEIYFGQPADQYMIDAPQIEKAEELHDV